MKQNPRFTVLTLLTLSVLILSACGPTAAPAASLPASGAGQAQSAPVEFTGTIQAINGNQWTVNGQKVVVDAQALGGAPAFNVGDTVRIKGTVAQDGTVNVSRMEAPNAVAAQGIAPAAGQGFAPASVAGNAVSSADPSATPDPSGTQEHVGVVEAINGSQITIDGVTYTAAGIDLSTFVVGDTVKIHFITNTDGSLTITEIQSATSIGSDGSSVDDDDSTNDNSGSGSSDDSSDDSNDDNSSGGSGSDD